MGVILFKIKNSGILLASCVLVLSACGSDSQVGSPGGSSSSASATTKDTSGNYLSGYCGSTVVSNYNTVVIRCKYMTTEADAKDCKNTAQSFLNKYPGISCLASSSDSSSINNKTTSINAADIQSIIDKITALGL